MFVYGKKALTSDGVFEDAWAKEAESRHRAYLSGELGTIYVAKVMKSRKDALDAYCMAGKLASLYFYTFVCYTLPL